jgi:hypothetical protein
LYQIKTSLGKVDQVLQTVPRTPTEPMATLKASWRRRGWIGKTGEAIADDDGNHSGTG